MVRALVILKLDIDCATAFLALVPKSARPRRSILADRELATKLRAAPSRFWPASSTCS